MTDDTVIITITIVVCDPKTDSLSCGAICVACCGAGSKINLLAGGRTASETISFQFRLGKNLNSVNYNISGQFEFNAVSTR